ncbi:fumarylacetoacetate hydrolase family protein [Subtercola boreus]|uniref:Fumarylacetoacetate hydrolase n=1 Tax=Subtercola boreus TaxID=120213 RepID=A0A3E0WF54_9MICO|nr:fumarylacetoacetate hydrolase family protein [Subtercola boreus]RFA23656.1 fumarylacetoacetate hydrolase [Subtercola boreus]RFA24050.1 fumarylacetoacetate hydrolase [Subtercola boreus]RFA29748.1 fumarylacetoacetate hydrolase [Subtercola boreus]
MRFISIDIGGTPWVARLDDDGLLPIATVTEFWGDAAGWMKRAETATGDALSHGECQEIPFVPASARVFCIGLNYRAHAAEGGFTPPEYPTIFGRWTASLSVSGVAVPLPLGEKGLDWEAEVAAYVGTNVFDADEAEAAASVFGYSTFNDLTARRAQKLTAQWTLGKNADKSGPAGPLVTADEVGSLEDGLQVRTRVNGTEVQNGNTRDLIFSIPNIISLISSTLTLHPGDVIVSGTPEGVGYVRTPPWYLGEGDTVEVEIERLGTLVTPIGGPSAREGA